MTSAPASVSPRRAHYRFALAAVGIFTLLAGDFWRNLLSWWGWGAIVVILVTLAVVELVHARHRIRSLPPLLLVTLALMTVSILWSAYPSGSAVGIPATLATTAFAVFLATCLTPAALVDTLVTAGRAVLGLSVVFELVVATIVRAPVLPLWVDYSDLDRIPKAFYWSRDVLFEGGRIQGITGNANLLAMVALLALIAEVARRVAGRGWSGVSVVWIAVAVAILALTRSTTVLVAAAVVAVVVLAAWIARRGSGRRRVATVVVLATGGVLTVVGAILAREPLLALAGRSSDLTNRVDIWTAVLDLAVQRPVAGWGWMGYWAPWAEPLGSLVEFGGVTYLQAHNAWLDVFLQLGVLGLIAVGLLALTTLARAWAFALDGPRAVALAPLALLVAYLVQSLAESRLLTEAGWTVLVTVAVLTAATRWERPAARVPADAELA